MQKQVMINKEMSEYEEIWHSMLYISVVTPLKKYDFFNKSNSHYFMQLIDK